MKSFVFIALVAFLGIVAVQGYGPKIQRTKPGSALESYHHRFHDKPSHGSHQEPLQRSHQHGSHQGQNHLPSHNHRLDPSNKRGDWDNSPIWDRSDSRGSSGGSGSYDSYGDGDDSYGDGDDSYGPPDSYSDERDSPGHRRPPWSSGDYSYYNDHYPPKRPCKHPHTKRPPNTTRKPPRTTPKPKPTTPKPRPPTQITLPSPRPTLPPTTTRTVRPSPPITTESRPTRTTWQPTPSIHDTTHWETTTNSIPETTTNSGVKTTTNSGVETTTGQSFTTMSPKTRKCIESCPSTPEYNPVCGSNGDTYNNEGKLFCARSCGVNVTLRRRSVCPPPTWDYDDGEETDTPASTPSTTTESNIARSTPFSSFQRCMKQCRITPDFTPVCGSDFVTYMNMDRLKCARSCGEVVKVLCEKPCAACGFNPVTPKTTTTSMRPTTTPKIGRSTTEVPDVQECIDACPVTPEKNPVCGSNRVTYKNPSHLICAQICGDAVAVDRYGPCSPKTTTSTTTELPSTLAPDILSCIRVCPVTAEYDPVCGTNGLTYSNLGNLRCSKSCGLSVDLKHKSRCIDEFDLGPDGSDSTKSQPSQNIKGIKDQASTRSPWRSPATTTSLFTSRTTTTTMKPTPPITIPTSTTKAGPNVSSTYGFSIPDDVLKKIFDSTTPSTKSKNPDEDEDIDLDSRFNNET